MLLNLFQLTPDQKTLSLPARYMPFACSSAKHALHVDTMGLQSAG